MFTNKILIFKMTSVLGIKVHNSNNCHFGANTTREENNKILVTDKDK